MSRINIQSSRGSIDLRPVVGRKGNTGDAGAPGPSGGPVPDMTGQPAGRIPTTLGGGAAGWVDVSAITPQRVFHGSDAGYARPTTSSWVRWEGYVDPSNKLDGDEVLLLDGTPPSVVTALTGTAGDTTAQLDWTDPTDSDLAGVRIYVDAILVDAVAAGVETWQTEALVNGQSYTFGAAAYDTSGNEATAVTVDVTPNPAALTGTYDLFRFDAATLGVGDGGTVSTWPDQSASGYDLTPVAGGESPTLDADGINGQPGVVFVQPGGTGNGTRLRNDIPDYSNPLTMFVVCAPTRATGTAFGVFASSGAATNPTFQVSVTSGGNWLFATDSTGGNQVTGPAYVPGQVMIVELAFGAGGASEVLFNGAAGGTVGGNISGKATLSVAEIKLGSTRTATTGGMSGQIGLVAASTSKLATATRNADRAYLAARFGVTLAG